MYKCFKNKNQRIDIFHSFNVFYHDTLILKYYLTKKDIYIAFIHNPVNIIYFIFHGLEC